MFTIEYIFDNETLTINNLVENVAPQRPGRLYRTLANAYNYLKRQYLQRWREPLSRSFFAELGNLSMTLFSVLFLHPYLKVAILMVQTLWLIILLLLLTYLPLSSMDQATDVFSVLAEGKENLGWTIAAHIAVLIFALTVWFSCRMLFIFFDFQKVRERVYNGETISDEQENALQGIMRWIPPLLGLLPFFIFIGGLSGHSGGGFQIAIVGVLMAVYFLILTQNTRFMQDREADGEVTESTPVAGTIQVPLEEKKDYLSLRKHSFHQLRVRYRLLIYVMYTGCLCLFLVCAFFPANLMFSRLVGVVAGVFLAMSMWVFLAHALLLLDHHYKAPIAVLILAVILFFWSTNNHQVRIVKEPYFLKEKSEERSIPFHFVKWIEQRQESIKAWTSGKDSIHSDKYPVYIIASEGGGLRAAYWTASILGQLSKQIPGFYNQVYALSTVSGGSVGATIYTKLYADSLALADKNKDSLLLSDHKKLKVNEFGPVSAKAAGILKQDYLSPLTMAFLVPDMVQKLLPVSIGAFDRAQYIEESFDKAYRNYMEEFQPDSTKDSAKYSLNNSFMSIWGNNRLYRVPSLFMNCTRVEDGAKAIVSNLLISGDAFAGVSRQEVIDLQEKIHKQVPISTAAFMSARFPLVTPPATVQATDARRTDWFNIVDGGYIDNSGLETAIAVLTSISEAPSYIKRVYSRGDSAKAETIRKLLNKIEVHLILIKNSEQNDDEPAALRGLYEIKTPLLAFFNSWDRHIGSKLNVARQYLRLAAVQRDSLNTIRVDPTLVLFDLDRRQELVPLGWFLSERALKCMDVQADSLPKTKPYYTWINWNLKHLTKARPQETLASER